MRRFLLLALCPFLLYATEKRFVEITTSPTLISINSFEHSRIQYITASGNVFVLTDEKDSYFQILLPKGQYGWIAKKNAKISLDSFSEDELKNAYVSNYTEEHVTPYIDEEITPYLYPGQENYRYPRRSRNKNLNIDVDGFYEVKVSGRDYTPNDPTDPRWEKIINDEAYKKIPRNVLIGPSRLDISYDIEINGQLDDDLTIKYDIEQEPQLPGRYDVEVKHKDKTLTFFDLEANFKDGEYIDVRKALRGVSYAQNSDNMDVFVALGNERSKPLVYENFGTGQKAVKLGRSNILEGSETVYLNNRIIKSYTIDYFDGIITFDTPPQITDYIKVVYEFTNPIEDFLPTLARKQFMGWQFKWESQNKVTVTKQIGHATERLWSPSRRLDPVKPTDNTIALILAEMIAEEQSSSTNILDETSLPITQNSLDIASETPSSTEYVEPDPTLTALETLSPQLSFEAYENEVSQNEMDRIIADQNDVLSDPKPTHIPTFYKLAYTPILLGSETVLLDSTPLIRNEDYYVDHTEGELVLRFPIETSHALSISYDYYLNSYHTEDLIAKNSIGPYQLAHKPIIDGSAKIQLNGQPVTEALDYILDYDDGKLYFNYKVETPTIISVQYHSISTTTVTSNATQKPLAVGVTYMKETSKSQEDELVLSVTSENATVSNNIVTLANNPIVNTEDVKVYVNSIQLSEASYSILPYTGQIQLNAYGGGPVAVDYSYNKSFSTKETVRLNNTNNNYTYTNADDDFYLRNIPIKYNGFEYIEYTYNGTVYRLNVDSDFAVTYSDDGNTIQIQFLAEEQGSLFNTDGLNIPPPEQGDVLVLRFQYTSNASNDPGDVTQRMYGITVGSQITDKWRIDTEIVAADHNFSKARLAATKTTNGTGVANQAYGLNHSNLVENSEQVFINNELQQKDDDYIINYVRGEVKFRNQTPGASDAIEISYEYYDSSSTTQAGAQENFKLATKFMTNYTADTFKSSSYFKFIDREFLSLSDIQETKGSTVLGTNFDWDITPKDNLVFSYDRRKIDQGDTDNNERAYKTKDDLIIGIQNKMFNTVDLANGMEYHVEIDDPKESLASGNRRAVDRLTYAFNSNIGVGPSTSRATYRRSFSRSVDDIIDNYNNKDSIVDTNEYMYSFSTVSIPLIDQFSFSPYYRNTVTDSDESLSAAFSHSTRQSYGFGNSITPFRGMTFLSSYGFSDIDTISSTASRNLQETLNYLYSVRYTPATWIDAKWLFKQDETESPLLNQKGKVSSSTEYTVNKFVPKGLALSMGASHTSPITKLLKDSFTTYRYTKNETFLDNSQKHNFDTGSTFAFKNFEPIKGVSLENYAVSNKENSNVNLVQTSSASQNVSEQITNGATGAFSIKPTVPILKLFSYTHQFTIDENTRTSTTLANSGTTNVTVTEKPIFKRTQALNFAPPSLYVPLPFKWRIPLGSFSLNLSEYRNEETNQQTKTSYFQNTNTVVDTPTIEEDTTFLTRYVAQMALTPFNLFSANASISTENYLYRRNFSSTKGTTIRYSLDQALSVGYSPFKWLTLNGSYDDSSDIQYYSPSITASVTEIIDAKDTKSDELISQYLDKNVSNIALNGIFKPFKRFSLNGGYSIRTLDQIQEAFSDGDVNITSSNYVENTLSYGSTVTLFDGFSANMTYSEHSTEASDGSTTEGFSRDLTVTYKPIQKKNFKVSFIYNKHDEWGPLLNFSDVSDDEQGSGNDSAVTITDMDKSVVRGSVVIDVSIPLTNSPYIRSLDISGEGYIKQIIDRRDDARAALGEDENSYDITGMILKGSLIF